MTPWTYYARSNGKMEIFHGYLKKNFRAVISEGKSWQKELPKILMTYRASPHQISGKSPSMLLFNREIRTKVPHIEPNSNTTASALDCDHRSKCSLYQAKLKDYHDTKQHASPHNFSVGDVVFCANMKPNKLDSKFSLAKHVIIGLGRGRAYGVNAFLSSPEQAFFTIGFAQTNE